MKWVLDCGPLGHLARFHDDGWEWPAAALHVTREVAREGLASNSSYNQKLLAMETDAGEPCIAVHDIPVLSDAATMFATHLRPNAASATRNVGEDETIAFCAAMDTETIFVTADRTAAFVALSELGRGRVATPFDLWVHLRDTELISPAVFDSLCERTAKQLNVLPGKPWRLS
ncbi:MAG: hypothetical protein R3B72_42705 [Polyangiaceae bacterium]